MVKSIIFRIFSVIILIYKNEGTVGHGQTKEERIDPQTPTTEHVPTRQTPPIPSLRRLRRLRLDHGLRHGRRLLTKPIRDPRVCCLSRYRPNSREGPHVHCQGRIDRSFTSSMETISNQNQIDLLCESIDRREDMGTSL